MKLANATLQSCSQKPVSAKVEGPSDRMHPEVQHEGIDSSGSQPRSLLAKKVLPNQLEG